MLLGCGLGWALLRGGPDPPRGRDNFWGCFAPRKCVVTARAPKTAIYYLYNIQGGPKKLGPQTHDHNSVKSEPIFKKSFTEKFLGKFVVKWIVKIPPHLATTTTPTIHRCFYWLPCNLENTRMTCIHGAVVALASINSIESLSAWASHELHVKPVKALRDPYSNDCSGCACWCCEDDVGPAAAAAASERWRMLISVVIAVIVERVHR